MQDPPGPRPAEPGPVAVFATHPEAPEDGRIFLWSETMWYEVITGDSDAIAFVPIAHTQGELDAVLAEGSELDLWELDDELSDDLARSFRSLAPLLETDIEGFEEENHEEPEDELEGAFRMHNEARPPSKLPG